MTARAIVALAALGDPTRRDIFERLCRQPSPVGRLSEGLPISRPAVSQHLKVLKDAELVMDVVDGTKRIYHIDPRGIATMRHWLEALWSDSLEAFAAFADADEVEAARRPDGGGDSF